MQDTGDVETVKNSGERKAHLPVFSALLELFEVQERRRAAERQLQEEKYLRRTQRIIDFHERQRREALELRRCLDYVSQHAYLLQSALRGVGGGGGGATGAVPLSAELARQAATLQGSMAQCVANATRIRRLLAHTQLPQMDTMLAKMETELNSWTEFVERAVDATYDSEVLIENLHNLIAEQRRYVRELSSSRVFTSMCASDAGSGTGSEGSGVGVGDGGKGAEIDTPPARPASAPSPRPTRPRHPSPVCSTPNAKE